jgi:predicted glycosyltransferase
VLGRFDTVQARIEAQARLAYALGREPAVVDLSEWQAVPVMPGAIVPAGGVGLPSRERSGPLRLTVAIGADGADQPDTPAALATLGHTRAFDVTVLCTQALKTQLVETLPGSVLVLADDELAPVTLAAQSDVAVFFGAALSQERLAALALDMIASGRIVIDATIQASLASRGAPVLRGPENPAALPPFLQGAVLPDLAGIGDQVRRHLWQKTHGFGAVEEALGLCDPPAPDRPDAPRTVFLPTNGVGLGHARRCLMLARASDDPVPPLFAAFPSCIPMIEEQGYACLPLVSRSDAHEGWQANDLVNYLRLRRSLRPGDRFVFDGGYVFESIYKTILEKDLAAVWLRRGLWQPEQVTRKTIRRERVFRKVIVPSEAFEELNDDYSFGPHVTRTGPIVQMSDVDAAGLRAQIATRFGREFRELVVTMLGGGVAADRSAQVHFLATLLERRPECLHLVVVWPGSRVPAGLGGLANTRIVQVRQALDLCRAADLVVSAAGYNSFHECLYNGVPAIFIPQMAPYMDDQARRARAAADRGLAETVLDTELLQLEQKLAACLDGRADELRRALLAARLPADGTAAAAAAIAEVGR